MKIRIVSTPTAANGLQVEGGQATPISDNMLMLGGKSHEDGGTDISYNGQQVEAEKGEPVSIGDKGEAIVWGNMNVPGTSKKFKNVAKQIGEEEAKNDKNGQKAAGLIEANNPESKWERLGFNSGRVMQIGALQGQKEINDTKSQLANIQRALLETAHENNLDPQSLSKGNIKKAKKGAFLSYKGMKAADGTDLGQDPKKKKKQQPNPFLPANSYAPGTQPFSPTINDQLDYTQPGQAYQPMTTPNTNRGSYWSDPHPNIVPNKSQAQNSYYNNFGAQSQFSATPPPTKGQKVAAAVNPVYNQPGTTPQPLPTNQGQPYGNDPTRSDRNNNPGNIRYVKGANWMGATGSDAQGFAIFPSREAGQQAMIKQLRRDSYNGLTPDAAINKWTGGSPYKYTLPDDLKGIKIKDMNDEQLGRLTGVMTQGEGTRYGPPAPSQVNTTPQPGGGQASATPNPGNFTPGTLPPMTLTPSGTTPTPDTVNPGPLGDVNYTPRGPLPSNIQSLNLAQIAPELYGFATNKEVPVALQKYNPQLYVPYQMSFQDQINDNTAEANQLYRRSEGNPSMASSIGAGVYEANNKVRANEFRTNQGIQADTINKNVNLLNDAQLKNLQLADTQFTRQSEAKSRTREINNAIMNSIASKYQQNDLNNKKLAAFENLYDYRFNDTNHDRIPDQATYYGPDASFNYNAQNSNAAGQNPYSRQVVQTTKGGVTTRTVTPSAQDIQYKDLNIQKKQQDIYPRKNLLKKLFGGK